MSGGPTRTFHFRSLDELRAEAERLGVDVTFDDSLDAVLAPVEVAGRRLGNAMAIQPMEGCDAEADGRPGPLTLRRWQRFAEGGAKLVWGEATAVVPEGRANARQLWLHPGSRDAFARLAADTRAQHAGRFGTAEDFLLGLQLTHSGRWSTPHPIIAAHLAAVDTRTRDARTGGLLDAAALLVTDDELERIADAYVAAARLAAEAGFDFVDVKMCHTYLLNELLAARSREGAYGGDFAGRTRLPLEIVRRIRRELPQLAVAVRLNVYDGVPYHASAVDGRGESDLLPHPYMSGWGVDADDPTRWNPDEPLRFIGMLREAGVGLVNVTAGSPYYNPHIGRPYEKPSEGSYRAPEHPLVGVARHMAMAAAVQEAYPDLAVVGTGYSWLQRFMLHAAASNIRRSRVTLAGVGRGALAYPDFARDATVRGALDARKVCLTVSFCTDLMRAKHNEAGQYPTGCVPRDALYAALYKEEEQAKKVRS